MNKIEVTPAHRSFRLTRDTGGRIEFPHVGSLREAFYFGVCQQLALLILSMSLLDGGAVFRRVIVAAIAFWCFVLIILIRRRKSPTNGDVCLIKYGIWPLLAIVCLLVPLLGRC